MKDLKKYTDYKTILAVGLLCYSGNKFLLLKRSSKKTIDPGLFAVVGGKVEPGESYIEALVRETKEEIGFKLDVDKIQPVSIKQVVDPNAKAEWVITLYIYPLSKQIKFHASEDGEFFWKKASELSPKNTVPDVFKLIQKLTLDKRFITVDFYRYGKDKSQIIEKEHTFKL